MDWYMDLLQQLERLQAVTIKLAAWQGIDIADLYEDGYLQSGDLE